MALAIATIEAPRVEESLRAQGVEPLVVPWSPPARGDLADVARLTRAYADDAVEHANREALECLDAARPLLAGAGIAADLVPGMDGRVIVHAGPPCDWDAMGPAMRGQVARAAVFEGWAPDQGEAAALIAQGAIALQPGDALGVAAAMSGVLSPSMAAWAVHDDATGAQAWAPMSDGAGDGLAPGASTREVLARHRVLADRVAPGMAAALQATGPIDLLHLLREAVAMGDPPAARPRAATLLLVNALLPGLASRALDAVPAMASVAASGRFAMPLLAATARAMLQATASAGRSSLVTAIAGNGTDVGVMLAGMPGRWFTAAAPIADDAVFEPGTSAQDAAAWTGDQGLIACAQLAIDARLCLDSGEGPVVDTGIAGRTDGAWVGTGTVRVPLSAVRDALDSLVPAPTS
jgi:hypothetical protein